VAIIQISRIQVRRGRELQGTGVPRLTSGELGWAVDTQRLYIGSGSTQEGAPVEGNVRLLTAKDNILDLSDQYFYKSQFDESGIFIQAAQGSVGRTIQQRLDDFVSASSFGIVGNGVTDDTLALQAAINALFDVNFDQTTRAILYIPAGTYLTSQPLEIPPYAQIFGAGVENTIIVNNSTSVFKTIGDVPINQVDNNTQPRYVNISNLSIESSSNDSAVFLQSCRDSEFRNLRLTGNWSISDPQGRHAFEFASVVNLVDNNIFENITIRNFSKGFFTNQKISNNKFKNIHFYELERGIELGDTIVVDGPSYNVIENSYFELIKKEGIQILSGSYNTSHNNRFINVGNDGGNAPVFPVIDFRSDSNVSINDYFDRFALALPNTVGSPLIDQTYVSEISGRTKFENLFAVKANIGQKLDWAEFIKMPVIDYGTIFIDYVYSVFDTVNNEIVYDVREGVLEITLNNANPIVPSPVLNDTYTLLGDQNLNLLEFRAGFSPINNSIIVEVKNPFGLTNDVFYYTIRSKT
jgi:hypothetical protein